MQRIEQRIATGTRGGLAPVLGRAGLLSILFAAAVFFVNGLSAQTRVQAAPVPAIQKPALQKPAGSIRLNSAPHYTVNNSTLGVTGLPSGPTQLPYPLVSTPANDAWVRDNAWAAYNANLHHTPTAGNPNRLAAGQNLLDPNRFIEKPNSVNRYNFQFSDNEIRAVQAALRRLGTYAGPVDGILGPDTRRAIDDYQIRNKLPITGQPDRALNASLGIF